MKWKHNPLVPFEIFALKDIPRHLNKRVNFDLQQSQKTYFFDLVFQSVFISYFGLFTILFLVRVHSRNAIMPGCLSGCDYCLFRHLTKYGASEKELSAKMLENRCRGDQLDNSRPSIVRLNYLDIWMHVYETLLQIFVGSKASNKKDRLCDIDVSLVLDNISKHFDPPLFL